MDAHPAETVYGPIFIGAVFDLFLFGIATNQIFAYYALYKRDKSWMKTFVGFLFLFDSINLGLGIASLYSTLIRHFGDYSILLRADWYIASSPAFTAAIGLMVQLLLAWRIKIVTRNLWVVVWIILASTLSFLGGIGVVVAISIIEEFQQFQRFASIVVIWLVCSVVANVSITVTLVHYLLSHKTGIPATDDVINKIVRVTVQTGMITSVACIVQIILFLVLPNIAVYIVFCLMIPNLYTTCLMSSLNSRSGWRFSGQFVPSTIYSSEQSSGKPKPGPGEIDDIDLFDATDERLLFA